MQDHEIKYLQEEFFDADMAAGFPEQQKFSLEDGIDIYFPHIPLALQKVYMECVLKSIKTGDFAALESPTGTGKTLCLLSAALSYMHKHYKEADNTT
jgi:CRISPR/Cas system-associated endonuclease/helicase Cas3